MAFLNKLNLLQCFPSTLSLPEQPPWRSFPIVAFGPSHFSCRATSETRRSANYKPSIWDHDILTKSLKNEYMGEVHIKRADVLKEEVRRSLEYKDQKKSPLALLELIDDIQRLGLGYIFEEDIRGVLRFLKVSKVKTGASLHATALYFRLCRQHRFTVSQDVFKAFMDAEGNISKNINVDIKDILSLYEASFLGVEGEEIFDKAKAYVLNHLTNLEGTVEPNLSELVVHALELPLHYNITRLEAKWYINAYSRRKKANSSLLELAKLDFNMVQSTHQTDIIEISTWWKKLGLTQKLPFTRDRLVESFLWSVGMIDEPQYSYCREGTTKIIILITTIDDIYDVYATYDEAKLFTDAVERWDINLVEQLPEYMRLCFFALHNTINEFSYNTLKEQGINILPDLKKKWIDVCKCYLLESKWFHTGHKPTLKEYLENACVSITGPLCNFHAYVFMTPNITKEVLNYLDSYPNIIHWSSVILRLTDDLGTSKIEIERGDVPKSVQCYMNDTGATEETSRKYIKHLVDVAWKKMNAELLIDSPLPQAFVKEIMNFARIGQLFYVYGDGFGTPDHETKNQILSLFFDTNPL